MINKYIYNLGAYCVFVYEVYLNHSIRKQPTTGQERSSSNNNSMFSFWFFTLSTGRATLVYGHRSIVTTVH